MQNIEFSISQEKVKFAISMDLESEEYLLIDSLNFLLIDGTHKLLI